MDDKAAASVRQTRDASDANDIDFPGKPWILFALRQGSSPGAQIDSGGSQVSQRAFHVALQIEPHDVRRRHVPARRADHLLPAAHQSGHNRGPQEAVPPYNDVEPPSEPGSAQPAPTTESSRFATPCWR